MKEAKPDKIQIVMKGSELSSNAKKITGNKFSISCHIIFNPQMATKIKFTPLCPIHYMYLLKSLSAFLDFTPNPLKDL